MRLARDRQVRPVYFVQALLSSSVTRSNLAQALHNLMRPALLHGSAHAFAPYSELVFVFQIPTVRMSVRALNFVNLASHLDVYNGATNTFLFFFLTNKICKPLIRI